MQIHSTFKAIYKSGLLHPIQPLPLVEDQVIEFCLQPAAASEHPYISQTANICGGSPVIKGTRTPVKVLVGYYQMGYSVPDILAGYPHLTMAEFFDALSYYYDHQAEVDADRKADELENVLQKFNLEVSSDGVITPQVQS